MPLPKLIKPEDKKKEELEGKKPSILPTLNTDVVKKKEETYEDVFEKSFNYDPFTLSTDKPKTAINIKDIPEQKSDLTMDEFQEILKLPEPEKPTKDSYKEYYKNILDPLKNNVQNDLNKLTESHEQSLFNEKLLRSDIKGIYMQEGVAPLDMLSQLDNISKLNNATQKRLDYLKIANDLLTKAEKYNETADEKGLDAFLSGFQNNDVVGEVLTFGMKDLKTQFNLLNVAKKYSTNPEEVNEEEYTALYIYGLFNDVQQNRETATLNKVGSSVASSIPFMVQYMLSGGTSIIVKKGATKFIEKEIKNKAAKYVSKAVVNLTSTASRLPYFTGDILSTSIDRQTGNVSSGNVPGKEGKKVTIEGAEEPIEATAKSIGSIYVSLLTEQLGEGLDKIPGAVKKIIDSKLGTSYAKKQLTEQTGKKLSNLAGIQSIVSENIEEVADAYGQELVTGDNDRDYANLLDKEDLIVMGLSSTLLSGTAKTIDIANKKAHQAAINIKYNKAEKKVNTDTRQKLDQILTEETDFEDKAQEIDLFIKKQKDDGATYQQIKDMVEYVHAKNEQISFKDSEQVLAESKQETQNNEDTQVVEQQTITEETKLKPTDSTTPNKAEEVKGKVLTRVEGLGMGQTQAQGVYLSTEPTNRYSKEGEVVEEYQANIDNPAVFDQNKNDFSDYRQGLLDKNKNQYTEEDFEDGVIKDTFTVDDLSQSGMDKLSNQVTQDLKQQGFDSILFEGEGEGELVVFDKNKIQKIEKTPEQVTSEVLEKSTDPNEIYTEWQNIQTQKDKLQPWQEAFLGMQVKKDSFIENNDANNITMGMAKHWFAKKGQEKGKALDQIAQELSSDYNIELTPQDLADFIEQNPTGIRKTDDTKNALAQKYKEITGKPITKHETIKNEKELESFINEYAPYSFTFDDMREAIEKNKDKLKEGQYEKFIREINESEQQADQDPFMAGTEEDSDTELSNEKTIREIEDEVTSSIEEKLGALDSKQKEVTQRLSERLSRLANIKEFASEGKRNTAIEDMIGVIGDLVELGIINIEKGSIQALDAFKNFMGKTGRTLTPDETLELNNAIKEKYNIDDLGESIVQSEDVKMVFPKMTTIEKARRALEDKFIRLKDFQKKLAGKVVSELDVYGSVMLSSSAAISKVNNMINNIVKSKPNQKKAVLEVLASENVSMRDFSKYLWAKHAAERNAKVQERINKELDEKIKAIDEKLEALDINAFSSQETYDKAEKRLQDQKKELEQQKITDEEVKYLNDKAQSYIDEKEKSDKGWVYVDMQDRVQKELIEERRKLMLESGLIDQEEYDRLKEYENYVPYTMDETSDESMFGFQEGTSKQQVRGTEVKTAKKLVDIDNDNRQNPLVAALFNYRNTAVRAEKNKALNTLKDLVEANPNDVVKVVKPRYRIEYNEDGEIKHAFRNPEYIPRPNNNYIEFKENGKPILLEVNDADLLRALRGTGTVGSVKFLDMATAYMRSVITVWNPEFIIPNFARDVQIAIVNITGMQPKKGIRRKLLSNVRKAAKGVFDNERGIENEWSKIVQEVKDLGGDIGWMNLNEISKEKERIQKRFDRYNSTKTKDKLLNAFDASVSLIESMSKVAEMSTRVAAYKAAIDSGISKKEAALLAKNLTVNFEKKGEWSSLVNSAYLFSNAAIQGNLNFVSSIAKSPKTRAILGTSVVATALVSYMNYLNDDLYELISDNEKERNLIIMTGDGDYVKIPLGYGFNLFPYIGYNITDVAQGKKSIFQASTDVFKASFRTFTPTGSDANMFTPTLGKPIQELMQNRNWFGAPIKPEVVGFQKEKPESQKYFSSVSPASKWATEKINQITGGTVYERGKIDVSPEYVDHVIKFMGGGVATFLQGLTKTGIDVITGEKPDKNTLPVIRRFVGEVSDRQILSIIYDMSKESSRKYYSKGEQEKFKKAVIKAVEKELMDATRAIELLTDYTDGQTNLELLNDAELAKDMKEIRELRKKLKQ